MSSGVVGGRETVQHALSDRAGSVKALLDADFTAFDTAELLAINPNANSTPAPTPRSTTACSAP